MANLVVQHEPGDEFYRVLDVDANLIVGSFVDPQVANSFAAAGNTSKEALFSAVRSDVNATGGTQNSANSPPGTSPAPPYVQPSYIKTGSDSAYQQPTFVAPPGSSVTYVPPAAPGADPEVDAFRKSVKDAADARVQNTTTIKVADANYEGGFRYDVVPANQVQNSATSIPVVQPAQPQDYAGLAGDVFDPKTGKQLTPAQAAAAFKGLYPSTGISPEGYDNIFYPSLAEQKKAEAERALIAQQNSATPVPTYGAQFDRITNTWDVVNTDTGEVIVGNLADQATASEVAGLQQAALASTPVPAGSIDRSAAPVPNYLALYNEATGTYQVLDANTGAIIADNLPDQATANELRDLQQAATSSTPVPQATGQSPYVDPNGLPYDAEGFLNPGWALIDGKPVYLGGSFVAPATQASADASRTSAATKEAQRQQTLINQQRTLNQTDWRVRLSLARQSNYLYNVPNAGILEFLKPTDGVIFPYTPQISTNYKANYNNYDLTHSNYRGYYYQNSFTDTVTITGTFTAQTLFEANYLLAVIHFFRSATKMFYGQSQNLGSPPPICYLNGLGEYQFNKHAVLITNFAYTLPNSVDYIRAGSANNLQLNQNPLRAKTNTANPALSSVQRLANAFLKPGGSRGNPPPPAQPNKNNPTYVPTRMDITVTLLPVQSRTQVSQQFNLQTFANGDLLKAGFW